jgi:hypothetical protein
MNPIFEYELYDKQHERVQMGVLPTLVTNRHEAEIFTRGLLEQLERNWREQQYLTLIEIDEDNQLFPYKTLSISSEGVQPYYRTIHQSQTRRKGAWHK